MDNVSASVNSIWRSERLVYRGASHEDQDFIFNNIDLDPVNTCLATPALLAPPGKRKPEEWWESFKPTPNRLMTVIICLPADEAKETATEPITADTVPVLRLPTTITTTAGSDKSATEQQKLKPIGFLGLEYNGYGISPHSRAAQMGITIIKAYQNSGYGTEAVNWVLDWGFRHANLHSIHLGSVEYNKRAHRCYEKCGFTMDGRRRQCFWHDRKYWDLYFFSILEDEWEELRKKEEEGRE